MQTLTRRSVGDAAADLGLHFLHMSEGPFSHDAGHMIYGDSMIFQTISKHLSVSRVVFLTDVAGVYDKPPDKTAGELDLLVCMKT